MFNIQNNVLRHILKRFKNVSGLKKYNNYERRFLELTRDAHKQIHGRSEDRCTFREKLEHEQDDTNSKKGIWLDCLHFESCARRGVRMIKSYSFLFVMIMLPVHPTCTPERRK